MTREPFDNPLSLEVWRNKYCYQGAPPAADVTIGDTWARVAGAAASVEARDRASWAQRFSAMLQGFGFLPAGRILAGAGTPYDTTLFNCFVMGPLEDSLPGIFDRLKESAITMQWGGGIGCDFSTLRPRGTAVRSRGAIASGPVSFMRVWDAMCATMLSIGARRGAMMGTLRCDHPDIEEFIDAKAAPGVLTNFNLSVQITDEFMRAVERDEAWPLVFPSAGETTAKHWKSVYWPGRPGPVPCEIHRYMPARQLWQRLLESAYATAEPGVLFVDRINRANNLHYREHITTTNPCGEVPLPSFGACNLGSINLTRFVESPFTRSARLDLAGIADIARCATRFLDDVIDLARFPFEAQAAEARGSRRLGLGLTGLGDALIMLGLRYDSSSARSLAATAMRTIRDAAYMASVELAREKGAFGYLDRDAYLAGEYVGSLPAEIRDGIARYGIRNSHLLAIAPAGTISVLANNISSGIEPVFALEMERRVLDRDGNPQRHRVCDHAYAVWQQHAQPGAALAPEWVTALELSPDAHLQMQAVLQPLVDNSISKTINVSEDISHEEFARIYDRAFQLGLKGCTVFRPNSIRGAVLEEARYAAPVHCCTIDREAD